MSIKGICIALIVACVAVPTTHAVEIWPDGYPYHSQNTNYDYEYTNHGFNIWEMQSITGLKANKDLSSLRIVTATNPNTKSSFAVLALSCGSVRVLASEALNRFPFAVPPHNCEKSPETEDGVSISVKLVRKTFTQMLKSTDVNFDNPIINWDENKLVFENKKGEAVAVFKLLKAAQ